MARGAARDELWKPLEKSGKVIVEDFSAPPTDTNFNVQAEAGTDLSAALEASLQRHKNLRAVLVLTDGDWNAGKPPLLAAARFRETDTPIFAVSVGAEQPLPDLVLERATVPSYGLIGEQISIPFRIASHLPREVKTQFIIDAGDGEEVKKDITIPAGGQLQDAIVWSPRNVGEQTISLRLPPEADEALTDNNAQQFRIAVRSETLKVLVVDSLPRWEYRFLRNALERDPGVESHCVLFHPSLGPGGGRNYLTAFPGTKEQLQRYDVIFLGDVGVGEGELKESDVALIRGLVEQQGSGLIFLPGRRGRQMSLLNGPLADLMPVQLDDKRPDGVALLNEVPLLLSATGKGHLLTRFDGDENRNDDIWKTCPAFTERRRGEEPARQRSPRRPRLDAQRVGPCAVAGHASGRQRQGAVHGHGQRVALAARRRGQVALPLLEPGRALDVAPAPPRRARGRAAHLQPRDAERRRDRLPPGHRARRERLPAGEGQGGRQNHHARRPHGAARLCRARRWLGRVQVQLRAQARWPAQNPPHRRQCRSQARNRNHRDAARAREDRPARELHRAARTRLLTGGAVGPITDLAKVIEQITLLPEPKPLEQRIRLWADPWWAGSILFLLTVYWVSRKLAGMI